MSREAETPPGGRSGGLVALPEYWGTHSSL